MFIGLRAVMLPQTSGYAARLAPLALCVLAAHGIRAIDSAPLGHQHGGESPRIVAHTRLRTGLGANPALQFSPRGEFLAAWDSGADGRHHRLQLWSLHTRKRTAEWRSKQRVWAVAFTPTARTLVVGVGDSVETGELVFLNTERKREVRARMPLPGLPFELLLSPDGGLLAVNYAMKNTQGLRLLDTRRWDVVRAPDASTLAPGADAASWLPGGYGLAHGFSPDGRLLITFSDLGNEVWNVLTGAREPDREDAFRVLSARFLVWSTDGTCLANPQLDGSSVTVVPLKPEGRGKTIRPGAYIVTVHFAPSSRRLLVLRRLRHPVTNEPTSDYRLELWDLRRARVVKVLRLHGEVALKMVGPLVAVVTGRANQLTLVDSETLRVVGRQRGRPGAFALVASPQVGGVMAASGADVSGFVHVWFLRPSLPEPESKDK